MQGIYKIKINIALLLCVLITQAGFASEGVSGLERDDAYNRRIMGNEVFYQADMTHDYKLSEEDGEAWQKYAHLDSNGDAVVSFNEFAAGADLPYPEWVGEVTRNVVYKRAGSEVLLADARLCCGLP